MQKPKFKIIPMKIENIYKQFILSKVWKYLIIGNPINITTKIEIEITIPNHYIWVCLSDSEVV